MRGAALVLGAAMLLLAACGQKGPLYLPDKHAAVVTSAPAPAPATPAPAAPKKPTDQDADADSTPPQ